MNSDTKPLLIEGTTVKTTYELNNKEKLNDFLIRLQIQSTTFAYDPCLDVELAIMKEQIYIFYDFDDDDDAYSDLSYLCVQADDPASAEKASDKAIEVMATEPQVPPFCSLIHFDNCNFIEVSTWSNRVQIKQESQGSLSIELLSKIVLSTSSKCTWDIISSRRYLEHMSPRSYVSLWTFLWQ